MDTEREQPPDPDPPPREPDDVSGGQLQAKRWSIAQERRRAREADFIARQQPLVREKPQPLGARLAEIAVAEEANARELARLEKLGRAQSRNARRRAQRAAQSPDAYVCHYCGAEKPGTRDHIVPRSRIPKDAKIWPGITNLVPCCSPCNAQKGDRRATCECFTCEAAWAAYGYAIASIEVCDPTERLTTEDRARIRKARAKARRKAQARRAEEHAAAEASRAEWNAADVGG